MGGGAATKQKQGGYAAAPGKAAGTGSLMLMQMTASESLFKQVSMVGWHGFQYFSFL